MCLVRSLFRHGARWERDSVCDNQTAQASPGRSRRPRGVPTGADARLVTSMREKRAPVRQVPSHLPQSLYAGVGVCTPNVQPVECVIAFMTAGAIELGARRSPHVQLASQSPCGELASIERKILALRAGAGAGGGGRLFWGRNVGGASHALCVGHRARSELGVFRLDVAGSRVSQLLTCAPPAPREGG